MRRVGDWFEAWFAQLSLGGVVALGLLAMALIPVLTVAIIHTIVELAA